jgi:hypothetical protein
MRKIDKNTLKIVQQLKSVSEDYEQEQIFSGIRYNNNLVDKAKRYYDSMSDFREKIYLNKEYLLGNFYKEKIRVNGVVMTQEEFYRKQGKNPIKVNMLPNTINNIIGQFRKININPIVFSQAKDKEKESEMATVALQSVLNFNDFKQRAAYILKQLLISGAPAVRIDYVFDDEREKPVYKIKEIPARLLFFNQNINDIYGEDINFIGEIQEIDYNTLKQTYSKYVPLDHLKKICNYYEKYGEDAGSQTFSGEIIDNMDILGGYHTNLAKILNVWQKELRERLEIYDPLGSTYGDMWHYDLISNLDSYINENAERKRMSEEMGVNIPLIKITRKKVKIWRNYHISVIDNSILFESDTPFLHNSHPYCFLFYPLVDGQINPYISELLDVQKLINRNFTLNDMLISSSIKVLTIIPKATAEASGYKPQQILNEVAKPNGTLILDVDGQKKLMPTQLSTTPSAQVGIMNSVNSAVEFMRNISGVNEAMLGNATSNSSGKLFQSQVITASVNLTDIIEHFRGFLKNVYEKTLKTIIQFEKGDKLLSIDPKKQIEINFDLIRNLEFNVVISEADTSDVFRQYSNDLYKYMLETGMISLDMFLKNTSLIGAEDILAEIQRMRSELEQGKIPDGVPASLIAEYQQKAAMGAGAEQQQAINDYLAGNGELNIQTNEQG